MMFLNLLMAHIEGLKMEIGMIPNRANNRLGIFLCLNVSISFIGIGHLIIFRISFIDIIGLMRFALQKTWQDV